jgi:hypothetical protein
VYRSQGSGLIEVSETGHVMVLFNPGAVINPDHGGLTGQFSQLGIKLKAKPSTTTSTSNHARNLNNFISNTHPTKGSVLNSWILLD